jgi:spoIIIJ-associated protein
MPAEPKATLEKMLGLLEYPATVEDKPADDGIVLDIKTDDSAALIGHNGQTLADLQYILNRLLFQQDRNAPKVTVDVGGYRSQARDLIAQRARESADKVRKWGDVVELEPMNAFERRIVHQALRDDPDVESYSVEVEGSEKKVILLRPKSRA